MDTRIWTQGGMRRLVVPVLLIVLLLVVVAAGTAAARAPQRASAPTIESITPTTAPNTGPVAINVTGTGFATRARLTAKLVSGGITLTGSAQATRDFLARAHFDLTGVAAGTYSVVIANPDGQQATLPAAFVVTAGAQPKPAITKLKPTSGKRKATVTITGTGFGAVRSATSYVKFGAKKCATYTSWNSTTIKCKVPKKAAFGRVKVCVTTAGGASNTKNFTVKR